LHDLTRSVDAFATERDWHQFHAPKNIASALIVEAAKLLEPFQWMSEQQSRELSPEQREQVTGEMADVLLYLVQLGSVLGIDPVMVLPDGSNLRPFQWVVGTLVFAAVLLLFFGGPTPQAGPAVPQARP